MKKTVKLNPPLINQEVQTPRQGFRTSRPIAWGKSAEGAAGGGEGAAGRRAPGLGRPPNSEDPLRSFKIP